MLSSDFVSLTPLSSSVVSRLAVIIKVKQRGAVSSSSSPPSAGVERIRFSVLEHHVRLCAGLLLYLPASDVPLGRRKLWSTTGEGEGERDEMDSNRCCLVLVADAVGDVSSFNETTSVLLDIATEEEAKAGDDEGEARRVARCGKLLSALLSLRTDPSREEAERIARSPLPDLVLVLLRNARRLLLDWNDADLSAALMRYVVSTAVLLLVDEALFASHTPPPSRVAAPPSLTHKHQYAALRLSRCASPLPSGMPGEEGGEGVTTMTPPLTWCSWNIVVSLAAYRADVGEAASIPALKEIASSCVASLVDAVRDASDPHGVRVGTEGARSAGFFFHFLLRAWVVRPAVPQPYGLLPCGDKVARFGCASSMPRCIEDDLPSTLLSVLSRAASVALGAHVLPEGAEGRHHAVAWGGASTPPPRSAGHESCKWRGVLDVESFPVLVSALTSREARQAIVVTMPAADGEESNDCNEEGRWRRRFPVGTRLCLPTRPQQALVWERAREHAHVSPEGRSRGCSVFDATCWPDGLLEALPIPSRVPTEATDDVRCILPHREWGGGSGTSEDAQPDEEEECVHPFLRRTHAFQKDDLLRTTVFARNLIDLAKRGEEGGAHQTKGHRGRARAASTSSTTSSTSPPPLLPPYLAFCVFQRVVGMVGDDEEASSPPASLALVRRLVGADNFVHDASVVEVARRLDAVFLVLSHAIYFTGDMECDLEEVFKSEMTRVGRSRPSSSSPTLYVDILHTEVIVFAALSLERCRRPVHDETSLAHALHSLLRLGTCLSSLVYSAVIGNDLSPRSSQIVKRRLVDDLVDLATRLGGCYHLLLGANSPAEAPSPHRPLTRAKTRRSGRRRGRSSASSSAPAATDSEADQEETELKPERETERAEIDTTSHCPSPPSLSGVLSRVEEELQCPIDLAPLSTAVSLSDGTTVNEAAWKAWVEECKRTSRPITSPKTGKRVEETSAPAWQIRNVVEMLGLA
jgi:hypothetical protein